MPISEHVLKSIEKRKKKAPIPSLEARKKLEDNYKRFLIKKGVSYRDAEKKAKEKILETVFGSGKSLCHYSTKEIIDALRMNNGNLRATSRAIGITRATLYHRLTKAHDGPEIRAAIEDIKEANKDIAEDSLMKLVIEGDFNAIKMFLNAHAKDRGYGKDSNLNIQNNMNWKIEVVHNTENDEDEINLIDVTAKKKEIEYAENSDTA